MPKRVMKYNPAFLTPAELVDQFVVRHADFQTVMQTVRDNTTDPNRHVLVIGPRGSGKTMLVRRVAAEINRDPQLSDRWYPLIFAEESYQVTTPGEFWLEATFHLGQQTKDPRWRAKYDQYGSQWQDEETMRERALGQLMDFADQQGKRLLLIVENLGALLGDQISADDAWKLRHTLQNEPRVMLLATAVSRFEEIDQAGKAMYEQFRVHHLRPLDRDECRVLWQALTGQLLEGDRVRPIQILTGGNLRLLTILSTFGARLSLRRLMGDLVGLVDEHTEYFKSHLDALPPVERKVYLALAELWDPSTARDVAVAARLDVNRTSSLLRRLVDRGAVVTLDEPGRTKWYQVAERMYNVYYLFRRRGAPAQRVRGVVRFMISFYQPEQLVTAARRIADEVPDLDPSQRQDHYQVYCDLVNYSPMESFRDKLVEIARDRFGNLDDVPDSLARIIRAMRHAGEPVAPDQEAVELAPDAVVALLKAFSHIQESRFTEAEKAFRKVIEFNPQFVLAWASLGKLLHQKLSRFDEAEEAYRKAIEIAPQNPIPRAAMLGLLLRQPERREEGLRFAETAISQSPDDPRLLNAFAWALYETGEKSLLEQALPRAQQAVALDPEVGQCQHTLASIQCALGSLQDALNTAEKYLADAKAVRQTVDDAVNLVVELAARGEAQRALQVLLDSPSRGQLEPLAVGIRIFLGEDVKVAAEIKEIGLDVARRIEGIKAV